MPSRDDSIFELFSAREQGLKLAGSFKCLNRKVCLKRNSTFPVRLFSTSDYLPCECCCLFGLSVKSTFDERPSRGYYYLQTAFV